MLVRNLLRTTPISQINDPNVPLYQALAGLWDGPASDTGVTVNQTTALRVMAVFSCVRLIAETAAALPLKTYSGDGPDRAEMKLASERYIWDRPNGEQTQQTFWEQAFASALIDGNAFINTPRDRLRRIGELWVVNPASVEIDRDKAGSLVYIVDGVTMTRDDIVHVPAFSAPGSVRGLSPIGQARQAIGLSIAAETFGAKLFGQGSIPGGLLMSEAPMTEEQAKALKSRWDALHRGVSNAWSVAVLDSGAKFQQLTIPPEDAQFIETRRFQLAEIARLYRVPPHLIADVERSTSWGTGIEEQNLAFIQYTLLPWLRRFEQAITQSLLPVRPRYARFVLDGLLRGDTDARVAYYGRGRRDGWLSANDVRRLEDMPPIEGGDEYLRTPTGSAPNETPLKHEAEETQDDAID